MPVINQKSSSLRRSGTKTALNNIVIFSLIFIFFILGIELLLRYTHLFGARISWAKPDPTLRWVNIPGSTYWLFKENDHPITGKVNNFGFIDRDWSIEKPSGTYRIAVLGDSYVESMQVESERNFLALTEKALNNNGTMEVELMNFGQSGFTQTEELIVLKNKAIQFSPDMVILFFVPGNDIFDVSNETASFRPFYNFTEDGKLNLDTSFNKTRLHKIKSFISPLKEHSALVSLVAERFNAYMSTRQSHEGGVAEEIIDHLSLATKNPNPVFLRNYNKCKLLIKTMADYCLEKKIKFMLVTINNEDTYVPEIQAKYNAIDASFNPDFFEDDLRAYAKVLNIEYVGLQSVFREAYEKKGVLLHWGHWNYNGHELVAKTLSDKLKKIIYSNE